MSNRQKKSRIGEMLEDYARAVPDNLDLWPAMRDRLDPTAKRRRPRDRRIPSWWIAVPACLLLVAVAASALMPQVLTPAARPTAVPAPAGPSCLFKMAADGSGQTLLVGDDGQEYGEPAWSPDGSQIAFSAAVTSTRHVELIDGAGQNRRVLFSDITPGVILTEQTPFWSDPAWFPYGGYITVSARWHTSLGIFTYSLANTGNPELNSGNNGADNIQPAWSPNATMFAYVSNRDGNNEIYLDMMGQAVVARRLTNSPEEDLAPSWSPDSKKLIFSSRRDGNLEIYEINPDGSGQQRLTTNDAPDWSPVYSPDGKSIAFASKRGSDWEIYRMDADSGNVVNLTNSLSTDDGMRGLDWSPDGTEIVYSSAQRRVR